MNSFVENRGGYSITCYEVDVTPLEKKLALDFAVEIINSEDQYNRLLPENVNDADVATRLRIQRTYMGKVAELSFAKLLLERGKTFSTSEMFQIYEGQNNVDRYDFVMGSGEKVDVKCGFRTIHHLLAINTEQFDSSQHKDYYVAVKLNAVDINAELKLVDLDSVTSAKILGYAEYQYLRGKAKVMDLGEGPARILAYTKLLGINRLLNAF